MTKELSYCDGNKTVTARGVVKRRCFYVILIDYNAYIYRHKHGIPQKCSLVKLIQIILIKCFQKCTCSKNELRYQLTVKSRKLFLQEASSETFEWVLDTCLFLNSCDT